ncbi:MAG TPA: SRPBCC domain-containing protein [Actinocrinis sp.]|nr:SRPBCC domain-containing protein [Actinocrinis sp.]
MTHEFEISEQIEVDGTPEQIWDAIATGPGIDSWLMGRNQIDARVGGRGSMEVDGFASESTVTVCDPLKHFAFRTDPAPDGSFHAFEFLIEARAGAGTVLRFVHSGFLGEDWEAEYDGLRKGDPMYLHKLAQYVKYFSGRYSAPIGGYVGGTPDRQRTWELLHGALGTSASDAVGDEVRLTPAGLAPIDGVVDYVSADFFGLRTADALYRFIYGYNGAVVLGHHLYGAPGQSAPDVKEAQEAWQNWLAAVFG